jgi:N-methylhydantoinase A
MPAWSVPFAVFPWSAALGVREVIVPRDPGLLSAWGAAHAEVKRDYVRTVRVTNPSAAQLHALCAPLERAARIELREEGVLPARQALIKTVDVRYQGQSHEINLPLGPAVGVCSAGPACGPEPSVDGPLPSGSLRVAKSDRRLGQCIAAAFHSAHRRLYGYADTSRPIEVVNVRLLAIGRSVRPRRLPFAIGAGQPAWRHRVHWNGRWRAAPHHSRAHLPVGTVVHGPALIAEFSATTFVAPGWRALVHPAGHLRLTYAR